MAIFNSYVKLPEGKRTRGQEVDGVVHISSGGHIYKYSTSKSGGISTRFNLYPLVSIQKTIENWLILIYPLKMVIFHSYVNVYQRVFTISGI
jgi:hypothetical protein